MKSTTSAREAALAVFRKALPEDGAWVNYLSEGRVLLIARLDDPIQGPDPIETAAAFSAPLQCAVLLLGPSDKLQQERLYMAARDRDIPLWLGSQAELSGHLGHFAVKTDARGRLLSGPLQPAENYDLVLDLCHPRLMDREVPPLGYFVPDPGVSDLSLVQEKMAAMVGEFRKPRYYAYDTSICAHGRNGISGCRRCLEACPTQAISSQGDGVQVDPYLCQGYGSCATACPSGAMGYAFPPAELRLKALREGLGVFRQHAGERPVVLFHDLQCEQAAASLGDSVLPFALEEIGCVGLEAWLAALAWGAAGVGLLIGPRTPASVVRELQSQVAVATALLTGLGLEGPRVALIRVEGQEVPSDWFAALEDWPAGTVFSTHTGIAEKRTSLWLAIDALCQRVDQPPARIPLPSAAPIGAIEVDEESCTLCMSCTVVCPSGALVAGGEEPLLNFMESACLQCNLCLRACPEQSITLSPRLNTDPTSRAAARILYQDEPFHCIRCGKAFGTRRMIETINARLVGHPMFEEPAAMRRLEMCDTCRVVDMAEANANESNYK